MAVEGTPEAPTTLLTDLLVQQVFLWVDEGRLHYLAPPGVLSETIRERIALWKPALMSVLRGLPAPSTDPEAMGVYLDGLRFRIALGEMQGAPLADW